MKDAEVRSIFVEEFSYVLMYYTEVLNRLEISSEELSQAYVDKHNINMQRNYQGKYNK